MSDEDVTRGQLLTDAIRALTKAAKEDGGDPKTNGQLMIAIERANELGMPVQNI